MREFLPPPSEGRRYCGNYGCESLATRVWVVTGIVPIIMRSCEDCRHYFGRAYVSSVILVEEIDEERALLHEVMGDVEVRHVWSRKGLGPS